MEFSWQYETTMTDIAIPYVANWSYNNRNAFFDKNDAHQRWFSFKKIEEGVPFEIPACLLGIVDLDTFTYHSDEVVIPIYKDRANKVVSGAETILKAFSKQPFSCGLLKVTTPKGETYYGCKGLILDKEFNILLLSTIQGVLTNDRIVYNKRFLHINPSVFTDDTLILNKSLARKGMSFFLSNRLRCPRRMPEHSELSDTCYTEKVTIVIDNVTDWIKVPVKPKDPINIKEELNRFINKNISDILIQMKSDFRRNF